VGKDEFAVKEITDEMPIARPNRKETMPIGSRSRCHNRRLNQKDLTAGSPE
jgi:hypothetical protein